MANRANGDVHRKVLKKNLGKARLSDKAIHAVVNDTLECAGLSSKRIQFHRFRQLLSEHGFEDCLQPVSLKHKEDEEDNVVFYRCRIKEVLQKGIDKNKQFAHILKAKMDEDLHRVFKLLFYHDECTAGNVAQVASSQKVSLFYFAVAETGFLNCEEMWMPLAVIQHNEAKHVQGGFSAVFKAMVASIQQENLKDGLPLRFSLASNENVVQHQLFFSSAYCWIGDLDAIRVSYDCKGAGGLKCCIRCKNILKRDSQITDLDPYFLEIDCDDPRRFDLQSNEEIYQIVDDLLTREFRTKKAYNDASKVAGFSANPYGALADPLLRQQCPPDRFLFDPLHCYYANGCACFEVNMFFQKLALQGISRDMILTCFLDTEWKCPTSTSNPATRRARARLLEEAFLTGDCYKGNAQEVDRLLPLLGFYVLESDISKIEGLQPAIESFRLLLLIRIEMMKLKSNKTCSSDRLCQAQSLHQAAFKDAYGTESFKPKHHVRMHLPQQYNKFKLWVDTLCMEKRHRVTRMVLFGRHSFCHL